MSLLNNAKWNAFSQFFKIAIQVVNLIYLAKIIPPAEYGLMAMASVVTSFGVLLRDLGTSAAIIQCKVISSTLLNTVFWVNVIIGFILCLIIASSSHLISVIYNQPKLETVLLLLSFIFPLSSSAAAHLALMERESKFRVISFIEVSSSLFSVIIAVILANHGYGVYSLVYQSISLNLISCLLFWYFSSWRPSFTRLISFTEIKKIFGFSANLSMFNFINYFSRSGDSFIIGKFMSESILGSYNLAYRIMLFPLQSLTFVATRSLYPILSRDQENNNKILSTYNNCVFVIIAITAPLMTGIAILSHPFINIVFGAQWDMTASILKWLAPTAIIQSVLSTTGAVFSAKGRTDLLMRLGVLGTLLQFSAFVIGAHFDIITFAMCYLIANVINFVPVMYFLFRLLSGSLLKFIISLSPLIFSTFIMIFFLEVVNYFFLPFYHMTTYFSLVFLSFLGALFYFISLFLLSYKFRLFLKSKISRKS